MIKSKIITTLLVSQFKEKKTFMHRKFLWTAIVFASVILTTVPAWTVQRFIMDNDAFKNDTIDEEPVKVIPRQLRWNHQLYNPVKCLDIPNHTEWIVAPEHTSGLTILRGETVEVELDRYWNKKGWKSLNDTEKCFWVGSMCCFPVCIPCICYKLHTHEFPTSDSVTGIGQFNLTAQPKTIKLSIHQDNRKTLLLSDGDKF